MASKQTIESALALVRAQGTKIREGMLAGKTAEEINNDFGSSGQIAKLLFQQLSEPSQFSEFSAKIFESFVVSPEATIVNLIKFGYMLHEIEIAEQQEQGQEQSQTTVAA